MNTEDITKTRLTSNDDFRFYVQYYGVDFHHLYISLAMPFGYSVCSLQMYLSSSNFRNPNIGNPESIMNISRCFLVS